MSTTSGPENPVTASLLSRLEDDELRTFVRAWDALERMAVDSYRDPQPDLRRQAQHSRLRGELLISYLDWEEEIEHARRSLPASGQDSESNPFRRILNVSSLDGLQDSWELMRCFPQAREALNVYLLDRLALEDKMDA